MASKLDPAIAMALSLDPATTSVASHGGSGFASTFKITSVSSGSEEKFYFVKTGKGIDSKVMFAGEHTSLNAIHDIDPTLCPRSYAYGSLSDGNGFFLATDFLNLSTSRSPSAAAAGSCLSLAQKLARLHSTPAPAPEGYERPMFGFPVPTYCGNTEQKNGFKLSWADFYADNRLRAILRSSQRTQGRDVELEKLVEETASKVVPRLLGDGHLKSSEGGDIVPVLVHGDLWSGNHGRGAIGNGPVEEVVYDPSACWAHSEFELGIMRMFGGYGAEFFKEYHKVKGKDEPVEEFEARMSLYELYHQLNHFAIFGGGYRNSAVTIMRSLVKNYS